MGFTNIRIGNAIVNLNTIAFAKFEPDPRGDIARIAFSGGAETEFEGEDARIFWEWYCNCSQKVSARSL